MAEQSSAVPGGTTYSQHHLAASNEPTIPEKDFPPLSSCRTGYTTSTSNTSASTASCWSSHVKAAIATEPSLIDCSTSALSITTEKTTKVIAPASVSADSVAAMVCMGEATENIEGDPTCESTAAVAANPRRNLTQAFEALCVEEGTDSSSSSADGGESSTASDDLEQKTSILSPPNTKSGESESVSPTGVADFSSEGMNCQKAQQQPATESTIPEDNLRNASTSTKPAASSQLPHLEMHPDLKRELSQALVNRVSFYGIIHDINKEAASMAAADPLMSPPAANSNGNKSGSMQQVSIEKDEHSILVQNVTGVAPNTVASDATTVAIIDEEQWLLSTIATRSAAQEKNPAQNSNPHTATAECPPTFLQAMGEKEYENQMNTNNLSSSRTQLWKPSRSWWEAKSGKNPWMEPACHNKRWRYLWPLIHYHKFLAKCIKKLKRNGVDVKQAVSPVAVFLREEVCAVSDHLATVSLFDTNEWMAALQHFIGWTDASPSSQARLQQEVSKLKLRSPLQEPADVDSPLLRSQIDEQFLRTMEATRLQMRETFVSDAHQQQHDLRRDRSLSKNKSKRSSAAPNGVHNHINNMVGGHPPMYPRPQAGSPSLPKYINGHPPNGSGGQGPQWPQQMPRQQQDHHVAMNTGPWWNPSWMEQQHLQVDNMSAQSVISDNSNFLPQQPQPPYPPMASAELMYGHQIMQPMQNHPHPAYYGGQPQPEFMHQASSDHSQSSSYDYSNSNSAEQHQQNEMYNHAMQQLPHPQPWMDQAAQFYAMHQQHAAAMTDPSYYEQSNGCTISSNNPSQPLPSTSQHQPLSSPRPPHHSSKNLDTEGKLCDPETQTKSPSNYNPHHQPQSPFWAHLDQATLAMGLATPAKASPTTPTRDTSHLLGVDDPDNRDDDGSNEVSSSSSQSDSQGNQAPKEEKSDGTCIASNTTFANTAQPLLLQQSQYYGYGPYGGGGAQEGYGPPSPATQFMMSPQASFAYNYGYGFSPRRPSQNKPGNGSGRKYTPTSVSPPKSAAAHKSPSPSGKRRGGPTTTNSSNLTPPPPVRKVAPNTPSTTTNASRQPDSRDTSSSGETIAESDLQSPRVGTTVSSA